MSNDPFVASNRLLGLSGINAHLPLHHAFSGQRPAVYGALRFAPRLSFAAAGSLLQGKQFFAASFPIH